MMEEDERNYQKRLPSNNNPSNSRPNPKPVDGTRYVQNLQRQLQPQTQPQKTFLSYNVPKNLPKAEPKTSKSPAPIQKSTNVKPKIAPKNFPEKVIKKLPEEPKPYIQAKPKILPSPTKENKDTKLPEKVTTPIQQVHYRFAGKETLLQLLKRILPKEFIPTPRTGAILGIVFLAAILLGLAEFGLYSMDRMLLGDVNQSIKVGIPFDFLRFDLMEPETPPLRIPGLILDLLIYIFLSYAIDVGINYGHSQVKSMTADERKKRVKILTPQQKKGTLAEKMTERLFGDA